MHTPTKARTFGLRTGMPETAAIELEEVERSRAERMRRPVPVRAVVLSVSALLVPVAATYVFPREAAHYEALLWLLALVPAFLLAYYRGWRGVATALAVGMATLSLAQVGVLFFGFPTPDWPFLLAVLSFYVGIALAVGGVAEGLHRSREVAQYLALTDELTGLPNRRHARLFLAREFEAALRGRPLTVVVFDVDHLKDYNDRHGHAAGDDALRVFARVLEGATRGMNLSARFGGDEFVSVLSSADLEGALIFVSRVRERLADSQPPAAPLTISAGVAEYRPGMRSAEELLAAADGALYEAKADDADPVRVAVES